MIRISGNTKCKVLDYITNTSKYGRSIKKCQTQKPTLSE
jgi:hypothetical protein